jgi:adenosylmethionine-8-amino-7-oxononanoate aminotransferase
MNLLMKEECQQQISMISEKHIHFAEKIRNNRAVKVSRTIGTILAIELNTIESTSYTNNIRKKIYSFFLEREILLRPLGNIIYLVPPYVITASELDKIYAAIVLFLDEVNEAAA